MVGGKCHVVPHQYLDIYLTIYPLSSCPEWRNKATAPANQPPRHSFTWSVWATWRGHMLLIVTLLTYFSYIISPSPLPPSSPPVSPVWPPPVPVLPPPPSQPTPLEFRAKADPRSPVLLSTGARQSQWVSLLKSVLECVCVYGRVLMVGPQRDKNDQS